MEVTSLRTYAIEFPDWLRLFHTWGEVGRIYLSFFTYISNAPAALLGHFIVLKLVDPGICNVLFMCIQ